MDARLRLIISVLILVLVYVVGVLGFVWIDDASAWEALHFTSISLTTVGYGEPEWITFGGRVWSVFVITFGISAVLIASASLQAVVIGGDLRAIVGRRKLETKIRKLHQHTIICGYGRMGAMVHEELSRAGIETCVIDSDHDCLVELEEKGGLFVQGQAEDENILIDAGIMRAKTLVACLSQDAVNVFVTLTARSMQRGLQIVARAEQPTSITKLRAAGADRVISPQQIGAIRMVNIIRHPHIVDFFEVAERGVDLEMDEYVVSQTSDLVGKTLKDSDFRKLADAIVVAIKRSDGSAIYNPEANVELRSGDTMILIGRAGVSDRIPGL
jgi:voltage-gated potassium channel